MMKITGYTVTIKIEGFILKCAMVYNQQVLSLYYQITILLWNSGRSQETNRGKGIDIPLGWYDCGDGIYNPENHVVYSYKEHHFVRNAGITHYNRNIVLYISLYYIR